MKMKSKKSIVKNLITWFHENKEPYFFRKNRTTYRVGISEVSMQTRLSARFQTIALGAIFANLKKVNKDKFFDIVLGMLLYGKSESQWSAPHYKVE